MHLIFDNIGLVGACLYLIGFFNPRKSWSKNMKEAGAFCMMAAVLYQTAHSMFDVYNGTPRR